ncbi:MAG: biotin attachment protein [Proteobacteria bacterium]|nr:biotin attachment protein [Pseudomonadota bacterium]
MGKKVIKFMDTSFRDGFQSMFGARVLTDDFMPALEASVEAGITHFEAGGGARFQSLFFYCNESAFDMMDRFREKVGPDANLQTLARGINVVALSQQPKDMIDLHAKMFKKHGMTTIRNFDALNDIRNLEYSGERIAHHGLHHQIVITIMELPPGCEGAHTAEFYLDRLKTILDSDIPFHSICFKDATGTANPSKIYDTFSGARKMCPEGTVLWFHTHDTVGFALNQNMAAIQGGADGIDLSKSPLCGGTAQPDILSMVQTMKGTDYTLDVDIDKILIAEEVFEDVMDDYFFPPEAKMVSPKVILSPMPGGALTANTMMMRDTKTLHLYSQVIKEMTEVVRLGGFGSSVTPVSQFYFQQAYLNVTMGKWKKINPSYGDMVLGYFGRTPVEPDPEVVKLASDQLGKPVFNGDPLELLEPGIPAATKILEENNLPVNDENLFIISSCETKGLDFLLGKGKVSIRKKKKDEDSEVIKVKASRTENPAANQNIYSVSVDDNAFSIVVGKGSEAIQTVAVPAAPTGIPQPIAPAAGVPSPPAPTTPVPAAGTSAGASASAKEVRAQIPGKILRIEVKVGDTVDDHQTLLVMEAMKMETEVKAPKGGKIIEIHVTVDDAVQTDGLLVTME